MYVAHQVEVVTRRSEYRLRKARDRAHILEGLLQALDMIDADHHADPRFGIGRRGAHRAAWRRRSSSARCRPRTSSTCRCAGWPRSSVRSSHDEYRELRNTIAELEAILADERKLRGVIKDELGAIRDKYGDDRRTLITTDPGEIADLDLIEDEELVVVLSHRGYVKTVSVDQFRTQGRGGKGVRGGNLRDEDYVEHLLTSTAHSYLLFFSNRGRVYRLARARDPDEGPHRARHRAR